jgi:hypothetical protein
MGTLTAIVSSKQPETSVSAAAPKADMAFRADTGNAAGI